MPDIVTADSPIFHQENSEMLSPALRSGFALFWFSLLGMPLSLAQDPPQDVETIKIDTNLVTVPVIATDANGVMSPT